MGTVFVNTPEELWKFLANHPNFENLQNLNFGEGFDLNFSISGENWAGQVDYRVGRFVYELQRDILKMYTKLSGSKLTLGSKYKDLEDVVVTVAVKDGSTNFTLKIHKAISAMVQRMTGKEIAKTAILMTLIISGGFIFVAREERIAKVEHDAARLQEIQAITESNTASTAKALESITEVVNNALETNAKISEKALDATSKIVTNTLKMTGETGTSFKKLLKYAETDDVVTVQVNGQERIIPAPEAKANLPQTEIASTLPTPLSKTSLAWGHFQIKELQTDSFTVKLTTSGVPDINQALVSFTKNEDENEFYDYISECMKNKQSPILALELSVSIEEREKIVGARIEKLLKEEPEDIPSIYDLLKQSQ